MPILSIPFIKGGYGRDFPSLIAPLILGSLGGITFRAMRSLKFYLLASTLVLTILFTGNFYFLKFNMNVDILEDSKKIMLDMLKSYNVPEDKMSLLKNDYDRYITIAYDLVPFSSFFYSLILAAFSFIMIRIFMLRFNATVNGLEYFQLNDYLIFALISGWGAFLLADKVKFYFIYLAGINTALISSFLYLVQALGVIKFFLLKKGWSTAMFYFLIAILLFSGMEMILFILILLTGFGALDLWADFRKLNKKPAE